MIPGTTTHLPPFRPDLTHSSPNLFSYHLTPRSARGSMLVTSARTNVKGGVSSRCGILMLSRNVGRCCKSEIGRTERRFPALLLVVDMRRKGDVHIAIDQQVHSNLSARIYQSRMTFLAKTCNCSPLDRVIRKSNPMKQSSFGNLVFTCFLLALFILGKAEWCQQARWTTKVMEELIVVDWVGRWQQQPGRQSRSKSQQKTSRMLTVRRQT